MLNYICQPCRFSLLRATLQHSNRPLTRFAMRNYSAAITDETQPGIELQADSEGFPGTSNTPQHSSNAGIDITALLATPSWSVRSLLPEAVALLPSKDEITPKKLNHLLRLSALPMPKDDEEAASMLATLRSQLHFVRDIQSVNTDGVTPLQSIRDETDQGIREITVDLESLKEAFGKEEIRGRNKRPRRRDVGHSERTPGVEDWDSVSTAREIVERGGGRYFVVRSGKGPQEETLPTRAKNTNSDPRPALSRKLPRIRFWTQSNDPKTPGKFWLRKREQRIGAPFDTVSATPEEEPVRRISD